MKVRGNIFSSFRDPDGFLFYSEGIIYRQVNCRYKDNYECFIKSGLYKALLDAELLIPHEEADIKNAVSDAVYKIIRPEPIVFISYPYEWSYSQLKDAALITLKIQKKSLEFGMSLKDASAYNIQFRKGKPAFIDTLSFEKYREGQPWVAYRQFCQHFLAPLALMSHNDIRLNQLLRIYIDGIPLDLASSLLPFNTRFKLSLLTHIHLHARAQQHFADKVINSSAYKINRRSFLGMIDHLEATIKKLKFNRQSTEWANYYNATNYSSTAIQHKKQIVASFLEKINPKVVWDFGSNTGLFSRIASNKGIQTIAFDIDPVAVENNYQECIKNKETHILPLVFDLINPSPGIGWENRERMSLLERGTSDVVFALALVHHLAISNNVPFDYIAGFFNKVARALVIEFIPKSDSQVQRLLSNREEIFPDYTQHFFESEFEKYFTIRNSVKINDSKRTLYFMETRKLPILK